MVFLDRFQPIFFLFSLNSISILSTPEYLNAFLSFPHIFYWISIFNTCKFCFNEIFALRHFPLLMISKWCVSTFSLIIETRIEKLKNRDFIIPHI